MTVPRYIKQLRFGCEDKLCNTPTCYTFRLRLADGAPVRSYTATSARILACYLASQDDPEDQLCEYINSVPASPFPGGHTKSQSGTKNTSFQSNGNKDDGAGPVKERGDESRQSTKSEAGRSKPARPSRFSEVLDSPDKPRKHTKDDFPPVPKIDHRSFMQNLFNSFPMRMIDWLTPTNVNEWWYADGHNQGNPSPHDPCMTPHTESKQNSSEENETARENGSPAQVGTSNKTSSWSSEGKETPGDSSNAGMGITELNAESGANQDPSSSENGHAEGRRNPALSETPSERPDGSEPDSMEPSPVAARRLQGASTAKKLCGKSGTNKPDHSVLQLRHQGAEDRSIMPQTLNKLSIEVLEFMTDVLQHDLTFESHILDPMLVPTQFRKKRRSTYCRVSPDGHGMRGGGNGEANPILEATRWKRFIEQSLFYTLSDPVILLDSFSNDESDLFDSQTLWYCMLLLTRLNPSIVFHSLWLASESLFTPPDGLKFGVGWNKGLSHQPLVAADAARLISIVLHALVAAMPITENREVLFWMSRLRSRSHQIGSISSVEPEAVVELRLLYHDVFSDELAFRLARRLFAAVPVRYMYQQLSRHTTYDDEEGKNVSSDEPDILGMVLAPLDLLSKEVVTVLPFSPEERDLHGIRFPTLLLDWARTVMIQEWDGKPEISTSGPFGGALITMAAMFERRKTLLLGDVHFRTEYFSEHLDPMEVGPGWLSFVSGGNTKHLLNYPFLFSPNTLVAYFRSMNYSRMSQAVEVSLRNDMRSHEISRPHDLMTNPADRQGLTDRLRVSTAKFFMLDASRDNILADTFNQLWRRQERELLRPLKVRLGEARGEEGIDLGGIQVEYFQLVMNAALNPDFACFTVDERTKMTWFQPSSPEPVWKFQVLGMIVGLAVYNGLTLPITFPQAFYKKLLGLPVEKLSDIEDGWPDLCAGLTTLAEWDPSLGSVEDVFSRTYEFSVSFFGKQISRDMTASAEWPQFGSAAAFDAPEDAKMVTEENRDQFISDYIRWLTDVSIKPQYEAFEKGFFTIVDRVSLSIFDAEGLQSLIEGEQDIDIQELRRHVEIRGFEHQSPHIEEFWRTVEGYDLEMRKKLLEFVTASDRVPVGGVRGLTFIIQKNGGGDEEDKKLPTAYTCFGILLLPEYADVKAVGEKLTVAVQNAKGFGMS